MTKENESDRPSSLQEGLNGISQALRAAAELGIDTSSLIQKASAESGLSSKNGPFTQEIINKAEELRGEAKNNK